MNISFFVQYFLRKNVQNCDDTQTKSDRSAVVADRHARSCALLPSLTIPSAEVMKHINKCLYNEHDQQD